MNDRNRKNTNLKLQVLCGCEESAECGAEWWEDFDFMLIHAVNDYE